MKDLQTIPAMDKRPETGPMQFGGDWPGVFIRGDHALYYSMILDQWIRRNGDKTDGGTCIEMNILRGLVRTLESCDYHSLHQQPEKSE